MGSNQLQLLFEQLNAICTFLIMSSLGNVWAISWLLTDTYVCRSHSILIYFVTREIRNQQRVEPAASVL